MQATPWKKGMALAAALIFCGLAFVPLAAHSTTSDEATTQAYVTQYNADGSAERRTVTLSMQAVRHLKDRITGATSAEQRFSLLQEYGLLPADASLASWKTGMEQRAASLGLDQRDADNLNDVDAAPLLPRMPLLLNFLCKVNAIYVLSGEASVGLPPLFGIMKLFGGQRVAQFDLFDICWGAFGVIETKTLLRQHTMVTMPSVLGMAGFVGIHVHIPMVLNIYNGFSAITFAAGLGPHSINFNLASMALFGFFLGGTLGAMLGGAGGGTGNATG
ncbi:MAG: hypothetical protein R6U10_06345 [Thermoplasmatota archaeon]